MKAMKVLIPLLLLLGLLIFLSSCKKITTVEYNVDKSSCSGCGRCLQICPSDAIDYGTDGKIIIDQSKCTQCGRCVRVCPQDAIY